ncbi:S8 family serine peptidase [Pricia sp.]|uniref:S8 family serine peptidase n=1 Tax=Pricia sp. TaxID=2268138 RepID=UPI003593D6C9
MKNLFRYSIFLVLLASLLIFQGCCSLKIPFIENQFPIVGDLTCAGKNTALSLDRFIIRLKVPMTKAQIEEIMRLAFPQQEQITLEDCKCGDPDLWMVVLGEALETKGDLLGVVAGLKGGEMTADPVLVYNLKKSNLKNIPGLPPTGPTDPIISDFISEETDAMVLAVLDSGIDLNHFTGEKFLFRNPSVIGCIDDNEPSSGYNFIDNNTDIQDNAEISHGTFVTKKITEKLVDPLGAKYQILPLKISNDSLVSYWNLLCAMSFIKKLKNEHGVNIKIINASLGFKLNNNKIPLLDELDLPDQMSILKKYINDLSDSSLFITAAGNKHTNVDKNGRFVYYPVGFDSETLMGVGGLNKNSISKHVKSNYGTKSVDIASPYVHKLMNKDVTGTSIGTAQISASLAKFQDENPNLTPREIKTRFLGAASRSPSLNNFIKDGKYEQ